MEFRAAAERFRQSQPCPFFQKVYLCTHVCLCTARERALLKSQNTLAETLIYHCYYIDIKGWRKMIVCFEKAERMRVLGACKIIFCHTVSVRLGDVCWAQWRQCSLTALHSSSWSIWNQLTDIIFCLLHSELLLNISISGCSICVGER